MFQLTALGSGSQVNPQTQFNGNSITIGAAGVTIYTVPAGKKAVIGAFLTKLISFGTGTKLDVTVAGNLIREATVGETKFTNENLNQSSLKAGDVIIITSDAAGNNASAAWFLSVTELPA